MNHISLAIITLLINNSIIHLKYCSMCNYNDPSTKGPKEGQFKSASFPPNAPQNKPINSTYYCPYYLPKEAHTSPN